jgi:two-component system, cell cycle sensor histidine kinase and response regulator CckA
MSERQRVEEKLQQLNNELETRVEERTAELVTANADLLRAIEEGRRLQEQLRQSQKMESIGTLAGGLAHDFNNLLNIIQGYTLAIMRHSADPEKVIEDVQVIRETVVGGAALVQQLLTVARKTEAKLVPTDINGLLQRLIKLLAETFPKTLTITLDVDPKVPNVKVDANQINHALLNLCVNARDAMPDGGNLLLRTRTLSGAELCGRFREARAERYACISVSDTGLGMEEEIKRRVFEPFFTTKEPGQGTGLGLSVVYGIVSNQDGFIEATSERGRGSAFHIYLPIPKDQAALVDVRQPFEGRKIARRAGYNETILFVEDEVRQLHLMQSFLEGEGFRVLAARDGVEALELHLRHKEEVAVVILDLGLAKLNGWEAFQRMKQINPKVKGILASGHLSRDVESQMAKGGLSGVIQKPYAVEEVLAKIEDAIRGS